MREFRSERFSPSRVAMLGVFLLRVMAGLHLESCRAVEANSLLLTGNHDPVTKKAIRSNAREVRQQQVLIGEERTGSSWCCQFCEARLIGKSDWQFALVPSCHIASTFFQSLTDSLTQETLGDYANIYSCWPCACEQLFYFHWCVCVCGVDVEHLRTLKTKRGPPT